MATAHAHRLRGTLVPLLLFVVCLLGSYDAGDGLSINPPVLDQLSCPAYDASVLPPALPPAPTPAAGTVAGSFAVSAGGQATYTIPLVVPPGRLGMEPSLSIGYDSSAGQGSVGVGFQLQGLSAVTRCAANLSQDGYIRPVAFDDKDHVCLDGLRLVPVGGRGEVIEYRTFPDTFSRVLGYGGKSFTVYTRSGHVLQYGAAANSQAMASGGTVAAWWLASESDRHGNEVDYTYANDTTNTTDGHTREMLPARIDYTRSGTTAGTRAVVFNYQDTTPSTLYVGGLEVSQSKLIQSIAMTVDAGNTTVRTYKFGYGIGPGTERPVLTLAEECAGRDGPCKPATTFAWSGQRGGFQAAATAPLVSLTSVEEREARFVMADVNGDGLEDIVIVKSYGSTDEWTVALNTGNNALNPFGPPSVWAVTTHPVADEVNAEGLTLTPMDVDQDGNTDIFLDSLDPTQASWPNYRWLQAVPDGPPGQKFVLRDTEVAQPASVYFDPAYMVPQTLEAHRFARLGDVNGDGVADLIQCNNPTWDFTGSSRSPGAPVWTVNLWSPALADGSGPGFEPVPTLMPALFGLDCGWGNSIYVVDVEGTGVADLLVPGTVGSQGEPTYLALRYLGRAEGWYLYATNLPMQQNTPRKLHFLDVNGDGLTDAVYTGYGYPCPLDPDCTVVPGTVNGLPNDVPFQSLNDGKQFSAPSQMLNASLFEAGSLPLGGGATDWWGDQAIALDYNGDGRMDLLMPVDGHCTTGGPDLPCWVVLQSEARVKGQFTVSPSVLTTGFATAIDTNIPAPVIFGTDVPWGVMAPWSLPQVTDVNGDGRHDLVVPSPTLDGTFVVYTNTGPQDLLVTVTDGMNPLAPSDAGYVPTVSIGYGNLVDGARTQAIPEDDASPDAEAMTYLSRSDPSNDCLYPRACVVGSARVVSSYQINNGQNQVRNFSVRYRDARYHRLGRGSLGFGARMVTDDDAGSGSVEFYDNRTWDPVLRNYPFDGQVVQSWNWARASTQQKATQFELGYGLMSPEEILGAGGTTYFTLPRQLQATRTEGIFEPGTGVSLLEYVGSAEGSTTLLSRTTTTVVQHDDYGNVLVQNRDTDGIDETVTVTRTVANDPVAWLLGEVQKETTCGASALGLAAVTQCRTTSRVFDAFGDVQVSSIGDPADPGTQLSVEYDRDALGLVTRTVAVDAFGHARQACVTYEPEGIFPWAVRNGLQQTAYVGFNPGLGVKTTLVDPNGLRTQWALDGFGRVAQEVRPDTTWTWSLLDRVKGGGPSGTWWNLQVTTVEQAGAFTTTTLDGRGRPVKTVTTTAATPSCGATLCASGLTMEQDRQYDLCGRLTRATVPWMRGDSLQGTYADTYAHDAAGRVTKHTEPWGRETTFAYANNVTTATDWLGSTTTEVDGLGRTVTITDKNGGTTDTVYGPFSVPWAVTRLGSETTWTTPDAYGRTVYEQDLDRGVTSTSFDGFGEVLTIDDALGRHYAFTYDVLGRRVERDDTVSGVVSSTRWTYDTAAHGVGLLATVTSPAGHRDQYTYDQKSRPSTHTLTFGDTGESFTSVRDYDAMGRLWHVTYPAAAAGRGGGFQVEQQYDAFSNLVGVQDSSEATPFWQVEQLDGAGRVSAESYDNLIGASRTYSPSTGLVESIAASYQYKKALDAVQSLAYDYDTGLRMHGRTDNLQAGSNGQGATELFVHDALDRLTCAFFAAPFKLGSPPPICAQPVSYADNGNIVTKGGGAAYVYGDARHPHAVTEAGGGTFAYDAVGNQIRRPGVSGSITYTPFDLPSQYVIARDRALTLDYDGGQERIRKSVPAIESAPPQETVYFEGLYERVTTDPGGSGATVQHRYYVAAGSATVVVTREEGMADDVAYLLTDALGSVDVITDGSGSVIQRRSYDAFGAKRDPAWGGTAVAAPLVSPVGFTGQEGDDELGLVNMRGRIYDPGVGRFLTTDPLVARPGFTQSWNPYSYVWNSPLSFTDPSGFEGIGTYVNNAKIEGKFPVADAVGTKPTMEQQLGGAIDRARAGATADWNPVWMKDAHRDEGAQSGPAGVPQAVRDGSPFAGVSGPTGAGGASGDDSLARNGGGGAEGAAGDPDRQRVAPGGPETVLAITVGGVGSLGAGAVASAVPAWAWLGAALAAATQVKSSDDANGVANVASLALGAAGNVRLPAVNVEARLAAEARAALGLSGPATGGVGAWPANRPFFSTDWRSLPSWGHAFLHHGAGAKITRSLVDTAAELGPQGQWLNNEAAAQLLAPHAPYLQGAAGIRIPTGLGQVILPNGEIVPAAHAIIVPNEVGGFVTAYPIP